MASVVYTFAAKPKATAYIADRNGLLPTSLGAVNVYHTQNIFDSKLYTQKSECQREGAEKKNAFNTFFIHKMNVLTRFDSPIVSKSLRVSCVFGF